MFLSGDSVLLENSVITANTTNTLGYGSGGGIATGGGTLTILGCLFTQNVSHSNIGGNGGAINEQNAVMTVINSTFIGNMAAAGTENYGGTGGAIDSSASPQTIGTNYIIGCTFTGNTAQNGGGGGIAAGYYYNLTLLNDLIWNNTASSAPDLGNSSSSSLSINYTLIGNPSGSLIPAGSVGNILNVATTPPILGALANNGAPTQTMSEQSGSPSIGAGGAVTTLSASVANTTTTTITYANLSRLAASALPPLTSGLYYTIQIGSEQMTVTGASSTTLTVVRGINGTTAATHPSGASVFLVSDQRGYLVPATNPAVVDIGAYQTTGANARPTITAVNPNVGIVSGGATVTITGTNFTGTTAVFFDGSAATSFTVNADTQITATSPGGSGVVDVTVTIPVGGTSATSNADHFAYVAAPIVTLLNPATGGTTVVIIGTHFTGATAVYFDGSAAASFIVNSATHITATSPAGTGVVDVTVTTPGGTSALSIADQFTYIGSTTTTLTDNGPNPSTYGQAVSFTATVSGGSTIDGETVTIEDASNANAVVASPTLAGGAKSFTISNLTIGTHNLFAVYGGDATHPTATVRRLP
jgi:hypothetical protein